MYRRMSALVVVLLLGSVALSADTPGGSSAATPNPARSAANAPAPAAQMTIADQLKLVQQQLDNLTRDVQTADERITKQNRSIEQLRNDLTALTTQMSEQLGQQRQLFDKLTALTTESSNQLVQQRQILEAISQKDSTGRQIPRLSAAMQSNQFREEMQQVVNDSLKQTGKLHIANKTNDYHRIFVNRTEFGIAAGQSMSLDVPAGTVSTQLPGRELKNWTIAGPRYEQSVEIVPDPAPITTYTARPIYSLPTGGVVYYWP